MANTTVKAMAAKLFTAGLVVGAMALAAPAKANAQVSFGVHIGVPVRPVYVAPPRPYFYGPAYGYGYYHRDYAPEYYHRPFYGRPYGWR